MEILAQTKNIRANVLILLLGQQTNQSIFYRIMGSLCMILILIIVFKGYAISGVAENNQIIKDATILIFWHGRVTTACFLVTPGNDQCIEGEPRSDGP